MSWAVKIIRWSFYSLFFVIPLIFLPSTSELFEFNKMIAVYFLSVIIAGAWVVEMILQKKFIFNRSILDWPILIFLLTQSLSLLFSIDTRTSLLGYYSRFNGGLVSLLCYSVLYWAYVTFMDRKSTQNTISYSLLPSAFIVCIYGILQHFGIDAHIWVQDVQNRVFSTLGQPNWLAAYLVALIFIPLSKSLSSKNWSTVQLVNWLTFILFFITLLFTKSRSGMLAFGISSVIYWTFIFIKDSPLPLLNSRGGPRGGVLIPFGIFLILTLTLILTISNPVKDQLLKSKSYQLTATSSQGPALETGGTESGIIRKIVWTGAVHIWRSSGKSFWIGTGPETFAMAYYQHRPVEHNATSEWELLYNKAHNEFLNYLATTGILGLASYTTLLFFMFFVLFESSKSYKLPATSYALMAGWLTLPITNFWGFSTVLANLLLFLLPAIAISLNSEPKQSSHQAARQFNTWQVIMFVLTLFSIAYCQFTIFKYWLADTKYASGQKYLKSFSATQEGIYILNSYDSYLSAYELNQADPPISSDLATVMAYVALLTSESDPSVSGQLADTALALAQSAIDTSPRHPNYYKAYSRTAIILSSLDPKYLENAKISLEAARRISPTDPRLLFNLSIVARYQEDPDLAARYLDQSLLLKPDFGDALAEKAEPATASSTRP